MHIRLLPHVVGLITLGTANLTSQPTIRSYTRSAKAPAQWTIGQRPLLEIGGNQGTGPHEFSGISGATRQSDGSIVVADGSTQEMRIFDARGSHLRTATRAGRGPGEVQTLTRLSAIGDTLVIVDGRLAVHVFAPNGDWLRSLILPQVPGYIVNPVIGPLNATDVIQHLTAGQIDSTGLGPVRRDSIWLGRVSLRDTSVRVIAARARSPTYAARPGVPPTVQLIFEAAPHSAVREGRICLGYSSRYTITCADSSGRPLLEIRRALTPRPVTEAAKRAWREIARTWRQQPRGTGLTRPFDAAAIDRARFATTFPAFGHVLLARTGDLWIQHYPTDGRSLVSIAIRPTDWSIYDPQGRWIADCRLPARFTLMDAGEDFVIGVSRDDDDVERVTVWSLKR